MKTIRNFYSLRLLMIVASGMLFSCAQTSNGLLSDEQKKKMQDEIQPVIAQVYDAAAHADTSKLFDANSFTDFTYTEITGEFYSPADYKQMAGQWFGMITSEIIDKGTEKYDYIDENNVLWSYSGALTATYKNGQQDKYKPFGMTFLFRKINDKWKIVFIQESAQQPAPADTTKHS